MDYDKTHDCKKEEKFKAIDERFKIVETDLKHEARKHEDLRKTINGKLDKIYTTIQDGDKENRKYIFTVIGMFLGAIITLIGFIIGGG